MEIPLKSDGKPDIVKLMAAIESEVINNVNSEAFDMPRFMPRQANINPLESPQHTSWLRYLNLHWNDWYQPYIYSSHRKIIGKIVLKVKNSFQDLLRLTLSDYFEKEKNYQHNLLLYLNHSSKYIDDRDANIFWSLNEKIDGDISAVNQRTDEIFNRLANEVIALKQKVAELENKKIV